MAEELSGIGIPAPKAETEDQRLRRVGEMYPGFLQTPARALAQNVPGLKTALAGDPHEAIGEVVAAVGEVVGRIRDAIRPPQS